jgi:hypothetical protein
MSVPFEQEKARDEARSTDPGKLMIDTAAVTGTAKSSGPNVFEYTSVGSTEAALQAYPLSAGGARPPKPRDPTGQELLAITDGHDDQAYGSLGSGIPDAAKKV